jgi:hypothetical protein
LAECQILNEDFYISRMKEDTIWLKNTWMD